VIVSGVSGALRVGCQVAATSASPAAARASTNPVSTSVSKSATSSGVAGTRDSRRSRTAARLNPRLLVFADPTEQSEQTTTLQET
jgi:hypothetical protein